MGLFRALSVDTIIGRARLSFRIALVGENDYGHQ